MNTPQLSYSLCFKQAKERRKRAIRYALLSCLLTTIMLVTTGCSSLLIGKNAKAYKYMLETLDYFAYPSTVQIVSGEIRDGYLYCRIRGMNRYGYTRTDSYRISESGYPYDSSSSYCYSSDKLNYDAINDALASRYGKSSSYQFKIGGNENMFLYLILLVVWLCLTGLLASKASDIAADKGYEKNTWFHMCFWLGPIPFIIVAAMPDLRLREQTNEMINLQKQMLDALNTVKLSPSASTASDSSSSNTRSSTFFKLPEL